MKKSKRILALIGVVLLALLYLSIDDKFYRNAPVLTKHIAWTF